MSISAHFLHLLLAHSKKSGEKTRSRSIFGHARIWPFRAVAQLFLSADNVCFTSATMFARSHRPQCCSPTRRPLSNGASATAVRFFVPKNFLSAAAILLSACLLSSSGLDRTASSQFSSSRNKSNAVWLQIDCCRRPAMDSRKKLYYFYFFLHCAVAFFLALLPPLSRFLHLRPRKPPSLYPLQ